LEGRGTGEPCNGSCKLGTAGGIMLGAGIFWAISAMVVLKIGIQTKVLKQNEVVLQIYDHYPRKSIMSLFASTVAGVNKAVKTTVKSKDSDEIKQPNNVPDTRIFCKKICCDYRVTLRSRKEQFLFWSFRLLLGLLVALYIFFIMLKIKSSNENLNAGRAPDTKYNFVLDEVCAFNLNNTNEPFVSFATKQDAQDAGYKVAHCGKCASCSNPWDIKTYVETRKTIAKQAKKCAQKALFGEYDDLLDCLDVKIGFSPPCTDCWAENLLNTAKYCLFTCIKAELTGSARSNNVKGTGNETVLLNQCIYCDEKMSGPDFVTCSGVARRRLGITSEIERNPEEQCHNTDFDWVNVNFHELFPNLKPPQYT
jgi:hypothetical protein